MKRIEGKHGTTLVMDTYGHFGEMPSRPEPAEMSQAEREAVNRANRMPYSEVRKRFKWSDSDFSRAKHCGFPASIGRTLGGWLSTGEPMYPRDRVEEWRKHMLAFAATLK